MPLANYQQRYLTTWQVSPRSGGFLCLFISVQQSGIQRGICTWMLRNIVEHFLLNWNCWCSTPEEFLPCCIGIILITSGVRALAWLKKEEQSHIFAGCRFANLPILSGNVDSLVMELGGSLKTSLKENNFHRHLPWRWLEHLVEMSAKVVFL